MAAARQFRRVVLPAWVQAGANGDVATARIAPDPGRFRLLGQRLHVENPAESVLSFPVRLNVTVSFVELLVLDHRLVRVEPDAIEACGPRLALRQAQEKAPCSEALVRRQHGHIVKEHAVALSNQDEETNDFSLDLRYPPPGPAPAPP